MARAVLLMRLAPDANGTATAKVQKKIVRDFVTGNWRPKVEGWLPHYIALPLRA